ncbi:MAG: hypothetical protein HY232_17800 [Acidobacteria bacterium]|nr:hypothetical protein [Acidobacteriota bacterium]
MPTKNPHALFARGLVFIFSLMTLSWYLPAQAASSTSVVPQNVVYQAAQDREYLSNFKAGDGWKKFVRQYGDRWSLSVDKRNGRPASLAGQGIPWFTGSSSDLDTLDRIARAFLLDNFQLFRVDPDTLILNRDASGNLGENNQIWYLHYDSQYRGVPVLDAMVSFTVIKGNLTDIGMERINQFELSAAPRLTPAQAFEVAVRRVDRSLLAVDEVRDAGTLYVLPVAAEGFNVTGDPLDSLNYDGPAGEGYDYRLIYRTSFRIMDDERTLVAHVDAHTGEVLDFYDDNKYGQVRGGVYPRTVAEDNEVVLPFPMVTVTHNGSQITDLGGFYAYTSGDAAVTLNGQYFRLVDRCGSVSARTSTEPGDIDLGAGNGTDCDRDPGSGTTRAGRNSFYSINHARLLATKYLMGHPATARLLNSRFFVNTNISNRCNAFYSLAVFFFKSGGGCNNTGEISDVVYHEWGHGLDLVTNGARNGAKGEAVSDINSMLHTRDRCVGPGFHQEGRAQEGESALCSLEACPTSVRDIGCMVTLSDIRSVCTRAEVHCDSHVLSGAAWDLSQLLVQRYGENEGWRVAERLFFLAMPKMQTYVPTGNGNAYTAYLLAADDDGNIDNGVPDGDLIFQAFNAHDIAREEVPNFRTLCVDPPSTPALSAVAGDRRVGLSWTTAPGATNYQIVRRVRGASMAFYPLADDVTDTQYQDLQVGNGVTYDYIVTATVNNCSSQYGVEVSATPSTP